ncbi:peritrophin-55 [Drosophila guanche]|uniref:Blast:Peritrophin-55 n=1 Tax=Drosophila guanche TaxID=7266 RepID=A0A3B0JY10_DROGU|nr:peritrophin-55 [Drosophila guanche]SPP80390.1 blast:Peritrophin-55 [Drosophila guanche]
MRTVIFVLAAIVAVNAQSSCVRTPVYTEKIDPINCPKAGIKLPNYENAQTYYQCAKVGGTGTLTTCPNSGYFSYVLQNCASCDSYIPSTTCSALPFKATCVPIGATTPAVTTPAPSTTGSATTADAGKTTAGVTTAAPTTTVAMPGPPTDSGISTNAPGDTPSGTTIFIPQPPSPGESNVPTPVTPVPTAPNLDPTPPTAPEASVPN